MNDKTNEMKDKSQFEIWLERMENLKEDWGEEEPEENEPTWINSENDYIVTPTHFEKE